MKDGNDLGARVFGAASVCVVVSGLFLCGLGGALAIADPSSSDHRGGTHSGEGQGDGPKTGPHGSGPAEKTNEKPSRADDTGPPGNGGNPDNGNCGNDKGNGNAHGCGGSQPSSPSETPPSTTNPPSTTTTPPVGLPAPAGGGGGGGGGVEVPSGIPQLPPEMQLPAAEPSALDTVPGVGAAAAQLPVPPITLPVIVEPVGVGVAGGGGAPAPRAPSLPSAPRGATVEPPAGREPLRVSVGSNVNVPPSSYRMGYTEYLRTAGLSQVAALAVPGIAGMLVLTGAGGLVGYRQAKAGHAVHTNGTARFVN